MLNPFNYVPLRFATWCFGISYKFYETVIVSIYSSTFLTVKLKYIPCVILPIVVDLIPLDDLPEM